MNYLPIAQTIISAAYLLYCLYMVMDGKQAKEMLRSAPVHHPMKLIPTIQKERDMRGYATALLNAQNTFIYVTIVYVVLMLLISLTQNIIAHAGTIA